MIVPCVEKGTKVYFWKIIVLSTHNNEICEVPHWIIFLVFVVIFNGLFFKGRLVFS